MSNGAMGDRAIGDRAIGDRATSGNAGTSPMLTIAGLNVSYFGRRNDETRVIEDLSLELRQGETLALVGESGSGKSTLLNAIAGLISPTAGSIRFGDAELVGMKRRERRIVQSAIQVVFQNALQSLSPRRPILWQLEEPLRVHTSLDAAGRRERVDEVIGELGLSEAIFERRPHELSGGQAQRVVLARALLPRPSLVLFDEPTSALDVSVQASVLNLLGRLRESHSLTYLFVTHDLGVARHLADRVAVLRHGRIVELADVDTLFNAPSDPYTRSLLESSLTVEPLGDSSC